MTKKQTKTRATTTLFPPFVYDKILRAVDVRGETVSDLVRRASELEADKILSNS